MDSLELMADELGLLEDALVARIEAIRLHNQESNSATDRVDLLLIKVRQYAARLRIRQRQQERA